MSSNIQIIKTGLHTSIQDLGRKGFRSYGVPISGAMDKYSMILANKLLNNKEGLPVMEMTIEGPKLLFENDTLIVITGANISPALNNKPIKQNIVHKVITGDVISFGKLIYGYRAYLGIKDGFLTEQVLNSFSFYKGITKNNVVEKGDRIGIAKYNSEIEIPLSKLKIKKSHFNIEKLEVEKGPEFERLNKNQRGFLFSEEFKIDSLNNRMGYQLKNIMPPLDNSEIITSSVIPGTVQLTPSGRLIVLMRDCPTTGGYPRILQLTDIAINQLAQKKAGDIFKFDLESSFSFLSRFTD